MAGYDRKAKATLYKLVFEDPQFEGLEITTRSTSMAGLLGMAQLADVAGGKATSAELSQLRPLLERFVSCVVEWNLEDDGVAVPVTIDALLDQDPDFVMATVMAWTEAISGVPDPLGETSNGGGQSLAGSIPMETLSVNQAS